MKLIWPTVVVTVLVAVGVVAYVVFGVVLSTTDLRSGELEFEAREDGGNDHIVRFFDDEGDEIAKVFVRAESAFRKRLLVACRVHASGGHQSRLVLVEIRFCDGGAPSAEDSPVGLGLDRVPPHAGLPWSTCKCPRPWRPRPWHRGAGPSAWPRLLWRPAPSRVPEAGCLAYAEQTGIQLRQAEGRGHVGASTCTGSGDSFSTLRNRPSPSCGNGGRR